MFSILELRIEYTPLKVIYCFLSPQIKVSPIQGIYRRNNIARNIQLKPSFGVTMSVHGCVCGYGVHKLLNSLARIDGTDV